MNGSWGRSYEIGNITNINTTNNTINFKWDKKIQGGITNGQYTFYVDNSSNKYDNANVNALLIIGSYIDTTTLQTIINLNNSATQKQWTYANPRRRK